MGPVQGLGDTPSSPHHFKTVFSEGNFSRPRALHPPWEAWGGSAALFWKWETGVWKEGERLVPEEIDTP